MAARGGELQRLVGSVIDRCGCGRRHRVSVQLVAIERGALARVAEAAGRFAPRGALRLLADPETHEAAGAEIARRLRTAGRRVDECVLPRRPRADERHLEIAASRLPADLGGIVAVGSGTINDIGKELARRTGTPLITVGTAASMNGYASPVAALTIGGLKVTRPAPAPRAILLDTDVLAQAPARLRRAGFGDLASKPAAAADWLLSGILFGTPVCPLALEIAGRAVRSARARARAIGEGDPEAVAGLAESLVLSGISMELAGSSAPASGGEHLLSHYLDLSAAGWGRTPRLHGEQVAVGTRVSLALYRTIRQEGRRHLSGPSPADETDVELERLHDHLRPDTRAAVLAAARAKRDRSPGRDERRRRYAAEWEAIWRCLDSSLLSSAGLDDDLAAAGVPATFEAIGVPPRRARDLIVRARHMRDRFTVLDFAADLGLLERAADRLASL